MCGPSRWAQENGGVALPWGIGWTELERVGLSMGEASRWIDHDKVPLADVPFFVCFVLDIYVKPYLVLFARPNPIRSNHHKCQLELSNLPVVTVMSW